MESAGPTVCPVCTLYLRPGITLHSHLETHPKDKVIEALVRQQYVLPAAAVFNTQQVLCQPVVYHHQQQQQQQVIVASTTSTSSQQQQQQQQQQAQIIPVIVSSSTVSSFLAASSSIAATIQQNGAGELLPPNTQILNSNQPNQLITSNPNPALLDPANSQLLSPNSAQSTIPISENSHSQLMSPNAQILSPPNGQMLSPSGSQMLNPSSSQMLSATSSQMLNPSGSQLLNPSGPQMLNPSGSQMLNPSSSQMLNASGSQMLNPSGSQMLNASGSQMLNSSGSQMLNTSSSQMLNPSNSQMLNPSGSQMLGPSNSQLLSVSNSQMLNASNTQMLNVSNSQMLSSSNSHSQMLSPTNHHISQILSPQNPQMLSPPDGSSNEIFGVANSALMEQSAFIPTSSTPNSTILTQPALISSNSPMIAPSNPLMLVTSNHPTTTVICSSDSSPSKLISSNPTMMNQPNLISSSSIIVCPSNSTNSTSPSNSTSLILSPSSSSNHNRSKPVHESTILAQPPPMLQSSYSGYITSTPGGAVFIYRLNEEVPEEPYAEELNKSCQTSEADETKRSDAEDELYSKVEEEIEVEEEVFMKVECEEDVVKKRDEASSSSEPKRRRPSEDTRRRKSRRRRCYTEETDEEAEDEEVEVPTTTRVLRSGRNAPLRNVSVEREERAFSSTDMIFSKEVEVDSDANFLPEEEREELLIHEDRRFVSGLLNVGDEQQIEIAYLRSDEVIEYSGVVKDEPSYLTLTSAHQSGAQPAQAKRRSDARAVDMDGMNLMVNSECFTINEYAIGGEESVSVDGATIRADENMPARGELSGQESSNASDLVVALRSGCDLLARESWDEEEEEEDAGDYESAQNNFPINDSYSCFNRFKQDATEAKPVDFASSSQREEKADFAFSPKKIKPSTSADQENSDSTPKIFKIVSATLSSLSEEVKTGEPAEAFSAEQVQIIKSEASTRTIPEVGKVEESAFFGGNPIVCTLCNCVLNCASSLKQHSEDVHGLKGDVKYKCVVCSETFQTEPKFTQHLQVHPLECRLCGKYFYRRQNMQLHLKRHMNIRPYKCTSCDKSFLTKQKLDEHRNVHTGAAPIKCTLCDETFRRHSNLVQHRNRHHLDVKRKVKDFVCTCGEVFHSKKKLAWHRETHDGKPKACPMCSEKFVHAASLTRHMRKAHNEKFVPDAGRDKENVECSICKNVYLRSSLEVHMKTHTGVRPFACSICNKDFTTKWNLKLHKWTHAARINKPYKCDRCKGAFVRASDYAAHMNAHKSVRPYTCNHCGAQFIRKYNCLRHVREHERTKTHACQICGKEFHRSYYLKDHMRVHSGARPYACHICGKTSATKSNHNKHVRIHHARDPVSTEN